MPELRAKKSSSKITMVILNDCLKNYKRRFAFANIAMMKRTVW